MKKRHIRYLLFLLLISVSIGSYVFLNTVAAPKVSQQAIEAQQAEEASEEETFLPDIHIIKKLIEKGSGFFRAIRL